MDKAEDHDGYSGSDSQSMEKSVLPLRHALYVPGLSPETPLHSEWTGVWW